MDDQSVIIKLELDVNEINVILRSLGKHPFEEIATLISKIKSQGESQLAELQVAQETQQSTGETENV